MIMSKTVFRAGLAVGFAAAVILGVISHQAEGQSPAFGGDDDVAYAESLWKALESAKLIGSEGVRTRPYEGTEPHGAVLETYGNQISVNGDTGWVIVKKNFGPAGLEVEKVANEGDKHLKAVTVMFKRKGYDPENADWFYVKYKADGSLDATPKGVKLAGRVGKGGDKGCIPCHKSAPGDDFLFITDRKF